MSRRPGRPVPRAARLALLLTFAAWGCAGPATTAPPEDQGAVTHDRGPSSTDMGSDVPAEDGTVDPGAASVDAESATDRWTPAATPDVVAEPADAADSGHDPCEGTICPPCQECASGACAPSNSTDGDVCPRGVCQAGACVAPCDAVTCPRECELCAAGECVPNPIKTWRACGEDGFCTAGACVEREPCTRSCAPCEDCSGDLCFPNYGQEMWACGDERVCRAGVCVEAQSGGRSCVDEPCPECQRCSMGDCAVDTERLDGPCSVQNQYGTCSIDGACRVVCDPATCAPCGVCAPGACVAIPEMEGRTCPSGVCRGGVCEGVVCPGYTGADSACCRTDNPCSVNRNDTCDCDGTCPWDADLCAADPCERVVCPDCQICRNGACVPYEDLEGANCGTEVRGLCRDGECVPECQDCSSGTCVPDPEKDTHACGADLQGECIDGFCVFSSPPTPGSP